MKKTKYCKKCGLEKEIESNFFKSKNVKDGFENVCKKCRYAQMKKAYKKKRIKLIKIGLIKPMKKENFAFVDSIYEDKKKWCRKCDKLKSLSCFSKNRSHKDGLQYICKKCYREYYKKWRERKASLKEAGKLGRPYKTYTKFDFNKRIDKWKVWVGLGFKIQIVLFGYKFNLSLNFFEK